MATTLPTVKDVPWRSSYEVGRGVGWVSGRVRPTALNPFTRTGVVSKTHTRHLWVSSKKDFERLVGYHADASWRFGSLGVTGLTSVSPTIKYNDLTCSLVVTHETVDTTFGTKPDYSLTKASAHDAATLSDSEFSDKYGDHFVSGCKRRSFFTAVYVCNAKTTHSLNDFLVVAKTNLPLPLSAGFSNQFHSMATEHSVSVTVSVTMGETRAPSSKAPSVHSIKSVDACHAWYNKWKVGSPITAELTHYSTLESCALSPTMRVSAERYARIQTLFGCVRSLADSYDLLRLTSKAPILHDACVFCTMMDTVRVQDLYPEPLSGEKDLLTKYETKYRAFDSSFSKLMTQAEGVREGQTGKAAVSGETEEGAGVGVHHGDVEFGFGKNWIYE
ncbi:hypothetical protein KIPB_006992 [Kipferlia bialata]|uniref:Uncharacterized protein n=1 Tax=Kipferlia bialata TaxID=797122 RepID=A0A391NM51_9EUKA|nr:hypothetical protein KIPB_006992 [Kipferlia bialata]|eukprot:g6992.t1